jgi:hypothetical protein
LCDWIGIIHSEKSRDEGETKTIYYVVLNYLPFNEKYVVINSLPFNEKYVVLNSLPFNEKYVVLNYLPFISSRKNILFLSPLHL